MVDEEGHRPQLVPVYDDGEVVGVLPDGGGHLVMLAQPGRPAYVTRSTADLTGWRAQCSCGRWQSRPFRRVDRAAEEDLGGLRVYAGRDPGTVAERPDVLAEAAAVWERDHLAVLHAVAAVADAHRGVEAALLALDDAVATARAAGATWDAIGAAAGITRQSAHARWARRGARGRHR